MKFALLSFRFRGGLAKRARAKVVSRVSGSGRPQTAFADNSRVKTSGN